MEEIGKQVLGSIYPHTLSFNSCLFPISSPTILSFLALFFFPTRVCLFILGHIFYALFSLYLSLSTAPIIQYLCVKVEVANHRETGEVTADKSSFLIPLRSGIAQSPSFCGNFVLHLCRGYVYKTRRIYLQ
jgi:hypothetical protein